MNGNTGGDLIARLKSAALADLDRFAAMGERWAREQANRDDLERLHAVELSPSDAEDGDIRCRMNVAIFDGRECGDFATGQVDRDACADAYGTFAELLGERSMGEASPLAVLAFLAAAQAHYRSVRAQAQSDAPLPPN